MTRKDERAGWVTGVLLMGSVAGLWAAGCSGAPPPADPSVGAAAAVLERLDLEESGTESRLIVTTSAPVEWLVQSRRDGFDLELQDSAPGPDVVSLVQEEGLVATVEISTAGSARDPATVLSVRTRGPVVYAVQPGGRNLTVRISRGAEVTTPAPTEAPPASSIVVPPEDFGVADESAEYRIGLGDALAVRVFGLPELDRRVRVERTGGISLPLLGEVRVRGLTLREAEATIAGLLIEKKLVNAPEVSVAVEDYVSRGVTIQGAVGSPGVYQMVGPRTLLEMLVLAGGLAGQDASGMTIQVVRRRPDGSQVRTEVDAERLVEEGDLSLDIPLQPGDLVLVPRPKSLRVYVSGAVRGPGPIEYVSSEGITVLQAITAAGGPTERANLGKVQVIRRLADGTEERFAVNVKKIRKGKVADFPLEANDTVVVKEWFF